jgi:glycerol transport system substrate-binding protein
MRHFERSRGPLIGTRVLMMTSAVALMAASAAVTAPAFADEAAAKKWIDSEFQPSTLSKDDQMKEMQWFIKAAEPYKGMEINAVSETLTVHEYESKTLAKAFEEITGIKVKHDIIQEGDVVEKIQTQMQSGKNVYDGWINDSDFIGTHFRYGQAVDLTEYMATTSSASRSRLRRTAISTSCPTSSSRTSIGSATTGSPIPTTRPSSRPSTATTSAFP